MAETIYNQLPALRSRLSFQPLLRLWREVSQGADAAAAKICSDLFQRFSRIPGLLEPVEDEKALEPYGALIEEAMITIFPASFSKRNELHAVAKPFSSKPIYASSYYKATYLDSEGNFLRPLDPQVATNVATAKIHLAYKLILKKWYNIELIGGDAYLSSYPEREHNIHNYFELEWDPQFIDITATFQPPELPEAFLLQLHHVNDLMRFPELAGLLPLDQFVFDGLVITRIREVSERETVNNIRNILQKEDGFENPQLLNELKQQMRYLLRIEEADIGFTSFYESNREVELPTLNFASVLLRPIQEAGEAIAFCRQLAAELQKRPNYFWRFRHGQDDNSDSDNNISLIESQLEKGGWESALITALYYDQKIIGCVEVVTKSNNPVDKTVLLRLEHARELLQTALQQYRQGVQQKISQLVKEHFTAVQSSVEWKFSNAAIRYLLKQHKGKAEKMASVVFEDVYPLYGVIDIKNSSGERNRALQQDLLQQLYWIKNILDNVQQPLFYPLLQEVQSRTRKYIDSISHFLFAADEQVIQNFLRMEVAELFHYLIKAAPESRTGIEGYFQKVTPHLLNDERKKFEESVTEINNHITRYLEQEQEHLQKVYPHYFERFVTDGVDFHIYIGQSIAPGMEFHTVHLKNLRLWQLSFLATAAQQIHRLAAGLPVPLQTTQLVLVYNEPISIRFRNAERKFDVDGVRHAHYEIIKKRIDKALIKGTAERLTQPGTIAIVYSSDDEAKEYLQYIEYLQARGLLTGITDVLEVEELQAVSGLKALRVHIRLEEVQNEADQKKKKLTIKE